MGMKLRLVGVATALAVVMSTAAASGVVSADEELPPPTDPCDTNIFIPYVAGGDGVPHGDKNLDGDESVGETERYPQLLKEWLNEKNFPYCAFNTSFDSTSTDDYQDENHEELGFTQQSLAWDLRPTLITLQVGRENGVIKEHIDKCMDLIKDHLFPLANACAAAILADPSWSDKITRDLSDILNQYKVQMAGNPQMVVAVLGYMNPYPRALDVTTEIPGFCAKLVDTIPTCLIRWVLLPPVLVLLDQIVKKLNRTIEDVTKRFITASQGRFFFVNPYDAFEDHCMKMEVEIKTKVYHPTNTIDQHDSKNDFGCDEPWIDDDGTKGQLPPWHYLPPAVNGVLVFTTQTTEGMGAYPNDKGHECLAKLIRETNNGWGPLKWKLDIPDAAVEDPCDD